MEQFILQFFGEEHLLMWMKLASLLFLAVLFLQSGFDKISDREGNLGWLKGHFSKTVFKNMVPFMLTLVTLLEILSGGLCAVGAVTFGFFNNASIGILGVLLSIKTLFLLFAGQRIAKDYAGAATLASYFLLCLFVLYMFTL
ncbi:MAG: hypothetical protein ACJAUV_001862 [Flavobacteriales bacterium]|jgi:hypothetical protein